MQVAPEREIRTVVGLRPFRRSGFRVEAERLDELLVVYNYGHGGAGVTLSWGTSHLAMELALQGDAGGSRSCAVLGCGAVGLATARLMQRRGWRVTIYARELPPDTASNIAGAQWQPHAVSDPGQTGSEYEFSFVRAARLAHRYFQTMLGSYYGVRWVDNYIVSTTPMPAPWFPAGTDVLYPSVRALSRAEHPFDAPYARVFTTMLIEPQIYLDALVRDFLLHGGHVVVREMHDRTELKSLGEPVVFNCTGLGAREPMMATWFQSRGSSIARAWVRASCSMMATWFQSRTSEGAPDAAAW